MATVEGAAADTTGAAARIILAEEVAVAARTTLVEVVAVVVVGAVEAMGARVDTTRRARRVDGTKAALAEEGGEGVEGFRQGSARAPTGSGVDPAPTRTAPSRTLLRSTQQLMQATL